MGFACEVAGYSIETNALLPTVNVRLRITNPVGSSAIAVATVCNVYFGKTMSHFQNQQFITTFTAIHSYWVNPNTNTAFEVVIRITFTQEMLYMIEKLKAPQEDLYLTLVPHALFFPIDQQNRTERPNSDSGLCQLDIKMSDWAKIAYEWGKEMTLVPMSPKTHERIKELLKTQKHLRSIDDVINELIDLHTKSNG